MKITKVLSPNDCGINTHQSGILIPKTPRHILAFFPKLNEELLNPRLILFFRDVKTNEIISLNFIHYNNKFFGKTRNEYRLTGISSFLRRHNATPGDLLHFYDVNGKFSIELEKKLKDSSRIKLTEGWQ